MSIIRLEVKLREIHSAVEAFKKNRKAALEAFGDELRNAVSKALNDVLHSEIDLFLGCQDQADNKRNGFHPVRSYVLKGVGGIEIRMPKDRKGRFESAVIPAYERVDPRLKADMAVLHLAGLSTRTLALVSRRLLGVEVSKDNVSASLDVLKGEAEKWLTRPLCGRYWALYVDGTYFRVQRRGSTESEPSLVILGIDEDNRRSILAIEPGTKDNTEAWAAAFDLIPHVFALVSWTACLALKRCSGVSFRMLSRSAAGCTH